MKFNLENFPVYDHNTMTHLQYWEKVQAWVIGCKQELREEIKRQDKMLKKVPKKLRAKTHTIPIERILGESE